MYNEELEGFEEAENTPPAYVTKVSQQDAEKLARENEKLKKNLEKEKFFNKLLDQELKDKKAEASTSLPVDFAPARRGISSGAFYTVLVLALAMAVFIFYTLYNNGQSNGKPAVTVAPVEKADETVLQENPVVPAVKDTVPEIIATSPAVKKPVEKEEKTVAPPVKDDVEKEVVASTTKQEKPVQKTIPVVSIPAPPAIDSKQNKPTAKPATVVAPVQPSRPVIATYKVTSKANFYNNADENTLRSSFINGGNKTVNALEDKNGFIYVEYTNDNGMLNRGWLSKKDLTKE